MAISKKLLEVLVCPSCKGELVEARWRTADDDPAAEAPLLGLDCPSCRLRYPIAEGIPVMLVEQAQRIPN